MPIYEYECSSCKFYVEVIQKISEEPLFKCPSCGRNALKKLVSAPSFRLKGGGWYETDFKSDSEKKRNLVESGGDSDSSTSESTSDKPKTKSVSKPAAKPGKAAGASKKTAAASRKPARKSAASKAGKSRKR